MLEFPARRARGDKLLGPPGGGGVDGIGLETVGIEPDKAGIAGPRMSAARACGRSGSGGDLAAHLRGKYQGRVVAANPRRGREANYERCARGVHGSPGAAVGRRGALTATVPLSEVPVPRPTRDYEARPMAWSPTASA